jgi:hypothetical protein
LYNFALISEDNICLNAISTLNEGVYPQKQNPDDRIVEITEEQFNFGIVGMVYNNGQFEPYENRKVALLTPPPYYTGLILLTFEQQDLDGQAVVEPITFTVMVNGESQDVLVDDGTLEIELDCPEPVTIALKITAPRYQPFEMEVRIIESEV